jgi:hemerythrin superfamily protein
MAAAKRHSTVGRTANSNDAIGILISDHAKVKALFKEFEQLKDHDGSDEDKAALVKRICGELKVHTEIEEEIFYPAVRARIDDGDLMDEALVEHAGAKELIAQLEDMSPDDELYDAKVTVLGEQIQHHVKEEEGQMFPQAKRSKVDTLALGTEMAARKSELMSELELDTDEEDEPATRRTSGRH